MIHDLAEQAERRVSWVKRAVWTVLALGLLAFVIEGATRPADPRLVQASRLEPIAGFEEVAFTVTTPEGEVLDWCALLAATEAARSRGLMEQDDLLGYDGMVFRFDGPSSGAFWMFKTRIPLSIAYFDETGAFVSATDMEPCPADEGGECPTYPAERPYVHAIEVAKGDLPARGIGPGATLSLVEGDCR